MGAAHELLLQNFSRFAKFGQKNSLLHKICKSLSIFSSFFGREKVIYAIKVN